MLFNSLEFILALVPISLLGFFLLGQRGHPRAAVAWVVLASLFFYGYWDPGAHELTDPWRWWPLALICTSVVVNYLIGEQLLVRRSKTLLLAGVGLNLTSIGIFSFRTEWSVSKRFPASQCNGTRGWSNRAMAVRFVKVDCRISPSNG